jgi:hypothetical protein
MLQADTVFFFVVELSQQVPHHVATSLVVVGRLARERVVRIISGGTRVGSAVDLDAFNRIISRCVSFFAPVLSGQGST